MESNFLELDNVHQANDVDLNKYTFLDRLSAKKDKYCFKIREKKRS